MARRHEPNLDRVRDAMREHDEQNAEEERDDAARADREPDRERERDDEDKD
jgi:hypothetical protein